MQKGRASGGPNLSSGSATTTSAPDLLVGAAMANKGVLSGSGYTTRMLTAQSDAILEDEAATSSGAQSATASISGIPACTSESRCYYLMQMVAFRAPH